jgi:hypothetical protein
MATTCRAISQRIAQLCRSGYVQAPKHGTACFTYWLSLATIVAARYSWVQWELRLESKRVNRISPQPLLSATHCRRATPYAHTTAIAAAAIACDVAAAGLLLLA